MLIASPRPVPPCVRLIDTSAWEKRWNSRPTFSGSIPEPVSATLILRRGPSAVSRHAVFTVTDPSVVNFTALLRKFSSTCRSRATSPVISSGAMGSSSVRISSPLASAWTAIRPLVSSTSR